MKKLILTLTEKELRMIRLSVSEAAINLTKKGKEEIASDYDALLDLLYNTTDRKFVEIEE